MPACNEEEIIEATVREWYEQVVARIPGAELIVVDDCSKDRTGEILRALAGDLPGVHYLCPERNIGHGMALLYGLPRSTQAWIFQTDSDRQHVPADFWPFWREREGQDFLFGIRGTREDGASRRLIAAVLRTILLLLWGRWIADANCPFKLMRRAPLLNVLAAIPADSFIPMVMVSVLARTGGFRVAGRTVQHLPRRGGTQSLRGVMRWARVGCQCSLQLLRLRFSGQ